MSNLVGQVLLSQYRVDAFVASGGMGAIYRVWDLKRNVPLAMKVLHSELADDPAIFKRFKREANALKKLTHPNIVPFYGIYKTGEFDFLLESFIDGPSLQAILKKWKEPLPVKEALVYLRAITAALGYAHANGVVHCDVKPGNVLVDRGGNVYLTDFGIARHSDSTTTTMGTAGTPAYMAPEQIRGEPVSPATDIYALGVMLFEMLTGQRPFRGVEAGTEKGGVTANERIRYGHLNLQPPDPASINGSLSSGLSTSILKALAKHPQDRYSSTQELFNAVCQQVDESTAEVPERVILPAVLATDLFPTRPMNVPAGQASPAGSWLRKLLLRPAIAVTAVVVFLGIISLAIFLPGRLPKPVLTTPTSVISSTPSSIPLLPEVTQVTDTAAPLPTELPTSSTSWKQGKMVFLQQNANGYRDMYLLDLAAGSDAKQILISKTNQSYYSPWISPDGNLVVFVDYNYGNYILDLRNISAGPVHFDKCYSPTFTPDGSRILCGNGSQFRILDTRGNLSKTITIPTINDGMSDNVTPVMSPDGKQLVFSRKTSGNSPYTNIWRINVDGTGLVLLADKQDEEYEPVWSPDGKWIAYQGGPRGEEDIWIMDAEGNNKRQVSYLHAAWSRGPAWSPDGKWIAFDCLQNGEMGSEYGEIFVVSVESGYSEPVTETGNKVFDWRVTWGPK